MKSHVAMASRASGVTAFSTGHESGGEVRRQAGGGHHDGRHRVVPASSAPARRVAGDQQPRPQVAPEDVRLGRARATDSRHAVQSGNGVGDWARSRDAARTPVRQGRRRNAIAEGCHRNLSTTTRNLNATIRGLRLAVEKLEESRRRAASDAKKSAGLANGWQTAGARRSKHDPRSRESSPPKSLTS